MQPSRPGFQRDASMIFALQRTNVPCTVAAFGCCVTSTANTCTPTPICGAAKPTQPGETRMVATRSAASATIEGAVGSTSSPTALSTPAGAVTTGRTVPDGPGPSGDG